MPVYPGALKLSQAVYSQLKPAWDSTTALARTFHRAGDELDVVGSFHSGWIAQDLSVPQLHTLDEMVAANAASVVDMQQALLGQLSMLDFYLRQDTERWVRGYKTKVRADLGVQRSWRQRKRRFKWRGYIKAQRAARSLPSWVTRRWAYQRLLHWLSPVADGNLQFRRRKTSRPDA